MKGLLPPFELLPLCLRNAVLVFIYLVAPLLYAPETDGNSVRTL